VAPGGHVPEDVDPAVILGSARGVLDAAAAAERDREGTHLDPRLAFGVGQQVRALDRRVGIDPAAVLLAHSGHELAHVGEARPEHVRSGRVHQRNRAVLVRHHDRIPDRFDESAQLGRPVGRRQRQVP